MLDVADGSAGKCDPRINDGEVYLSIRDSLNQIDFLKVDAPPVSHLRFQILNWCRRQGYMGDVLYRIDFDLLESFLEGEWFDGNDFSRNYLPPVTDALKLLMEVMKIDSPYVGGGCWIVVKHRR